MEFPIFIYFYFSFSGALSFWFSNLAGIKFAFYFQKHNFVSAETISLFPELLPIGENTHARKHINKISKQKS